MKDKKKQKQKQMDICSVAGLLHSRWKDASWHSGAAARSAEGLWLKRRGCCTVGGRTLAGMAKLLYGRRKDATWLGDGAAARTAEGR